MPNKIFFAALAAVLAAAAIGAALFRSALAAHDVPPLEMPEVELSFTPEEQAYLDGKRALVLVGDPNWPPYDFVDAEGTVKGIAADYLNVVGHLIDTPMRHAPTTSWTESLDFARRGECDLVTMLNQTNERSQFLDFTDTYYSSHVVLVGREGTVIPGGLGGLKREPVALVKTTGSPSNSNGIILT